MDAEDLMLSAYQRGYRDGCEDGLAGREYHPDTESEGFAQWQADNAAALASQPVPASSDLVERVAEGICCPKGCMVAGTDRICAAGGFEPQARAIIPIVRADEREACARIAEMHDHRGDIATAIRERNGSV